MYRFRLIDTGCTERCDHHHDRTASLISGTLQDVKGVQIATWASIDPTHLSASLAGMTPGEYFLIIDAADDNGTSYDRCLVAHRRIFRRWRWMPMWVRWRFGPVRRSGSRSP